VEQWELDATGASVQITYIILGDHGPIATRRAAMRLARAVPKGIVREGESVAVSVRRLRIVQPAGSARWVTPTRCEGFSSMAAREVTCVPGCRSAWLGGALQGEDGQMPMRAEAGARDGEASWVVVLRDDVCPEPRSIAALELAIVRADPAVVAIGPVLTRGSRGARPAVLPGRAFAARARVLEGIAWGDCLDRDPRWPLWWLSAELATRGGGEGSVITQPAWSMGVLRARSARAGERDPSAKAAVRASVDPAIWDLLRGVTGARAALAPQLARLATRRVALVEAGPGSGAVREAVLSLGGEIVGEHEGPSGLVVGTLSPAMVIDAVQRRLRQRLCREVPLLVGWSPPTLAGVSVQSRVRAAHLAA
jgi:hypothetical protein